MQNVQVLLQPTLTDTQAAYADSRRVGSVRREDLERLEDLDLRLVVDPRALEQRRQAADVVGAEDHVDPRRLLGDGRAVLLRQAAADRDLHAGPRGLLRREVAEVAVELVVGVLPHRAGVEDDDVGVARPSGTRDVARLLEQPAEPLGVVDVHLAPVGADLVGAHDRSRVGGDQRRAILVACVHDWRCSPRSRAADTRRRSTATSPASGRATDGHGDSTWAWRRSSCPQATRCSCPGPRSTSTWRRSMRPQWVNVTTGLVLGFFEDQAQSVRRPCSTSELALVDRVDRLGAVALVGPLGAVHRVGGFVREHRQRRVVRVGVLDRVVAERRLVAVAPVHRLGAVTPERTARCCRARRPGRCSGRRTDGNLPRSSAVALAALLGGRRRRTPVVLASRRQAGLVGRLVVGEGELEPPSSTVVLRSCERARYTLLSTFAALAAAALSAVQ